MFVTRCTHKMGLWATFRSTIVSRRLEDNCIRGKMEHFRVFPVFRGPLAFLFWRRLGILSIWRRLIGAIHRWARIQAGSVISVMRWQWLLMRLNNYSFSIGQRR